MPLDPGHLQRFKDDLLVLAPGEVFDRYVRPDPCMGLAEVDECALRGRIADRFGVAAQSVLIVGSAKLGFTIVDKTRSDPSRPRYSPFSAGSDVDIAIVSDALFDAYWKNTFEFWQGSGYQFAATYWGRTSKFAEYMFQGWIRPDRLPAEGGYTLKREWFSFFSELESARAAGDHKIRAGLFREDYFLQAYQTRAIKNCQTFAGLAR